MDSTNGSASVYLPFAVVRVAAAVVAEMTTSPPHKLAIPCGVAHPGSGIARRGWR
jgi:hypothetical protein